MLKTSSPPETPVKPSQRGMGDISLINLLNTIMADTKKGRSAVVILQAETVLHHFDSRRILAGMIGEWARLPATNTNICIPVFSAFELEQLREHSVYITVPEIRNSILDPKSDGFAQVKKISSPQGDEILRLFHKTKVDNSSRLNSARLTEMIQSEGGSMRMGLLLGRPLLAAEVGGMKLEDRVSLGGKDLVLNGAGIRTRFMLKIYVCSLYLPARASDLAGVLAAQPRRVQLNLLRDLSARDLAGALADGIKETSTAEQAAAVKAQTDQRLSIMKSVGEAMAIGRTFKEALQKGLRSLEVGCQLERHQQQGLALQDVSGDVILAVTGGQWPFDLTRRHPGGQLPRSERCGWRSTRQA